MEREPMFCMETAIKALYWSMLVYEYEATDVTADELANDVAADKSLEVHRSITRPRPSAQATCDCCAEHCQM